jgi:cell division septation protein DedD
MKDLIKHIEHLLPGHDCVVVPGLGGFVLNEVPVRTDHEHEIFHPRGKEISFNIRLTFNDGILVQSYQEALGITFEAAVEIVREKVKEIQHQLDEGRYLGFGRLGTLLKNEQGQLVFRPDNRNLFCPESYGLTAFAYPTLKNRIQAMQAETKQRKDGYIHIRLRRNAFRSILTGAAACLLILLISKPAGELQNLENQQAFLLKDYLISGPETVVDSLAPLVVDEKNDGTTGAATTHKTDKTQSAVTADMMKSAETRKISELKKKSVSTSKTVTMKETVLTGTGKATSGYETSAPARTIRQSTPSTDDIDALFGITPTDTPKHLVQSDRDTHVIKTIQPKPTALTKTAMTADASSKSYYIIISSHPSKTTAQTWIENNRKGIYEQASIVEGDGRARISIKHFRQKAEAETYLNQFRANNPKHADAWLLSAKS